MIYLSILLKYINNIFKILKYLNKKMQILLKKKILNLLLNNIIYI